MVIQTVNPSGTPAGASGAPGRVVEVPAAAVAPADPTGGSSGVSSTLRPAQVSGAVQTLNQSSFLNRNLTFSVDKSTHETVVKVVEAQTGRVITQIPSQQALAIAQAIDALPPHQGVLLNQKA